MIVSLLRGERPLHFRYQAAGSGAVCLGCGDWERRESIAPVTLLDGGEIDPLASSGAYLCRYCSMRLPQMRQCVRDEWPPLTAIEVETVWKLVQAEIKRDAAALEARERSIARTLDDIQAATATLMDRGIEKQLADSIEFNARLKQIGGSAQ